MALVFSTHDEFSMLMWGVPLARDVVKSEKLMKVFGVTDTIEPGKVYGSIEDGTARVLYQPNTTHPGDHSLARPSVMRSRGSRKPWARKTRFLQ